MSGSLVLGIETSCDETGVGLVRVGDAGNELLVDAIASSVDEHARFGGIIPEVASRAHLEAMVPTLQRALAEAEVELGDIDAIAVTAGPGLVGPLTVGAAAAKALAVGLSRPLYGVNHVIGHVAVDELVHGLFPERFLALVVSGGHSSLLLVDDIATGVTELGAMAQERCAAAGITVRIPPIRFCTDNGAMIAALGAAVLRRGVPASGLDLPVDSSMPLTRITV